MEKKHRPRISELKPEMKYGIPFSSDEMEFTILALKEFRKFHAHPDDQPRLTPKGIAMLDKLIDGLEVARTFFKSAK